jgi:hypothetical protein
MGDTQGRRWEVGVGNDRALFFQPQGDSARTWYVDASDIDLERSLDSLQNGIYATYQDANGNTVRTTANDDAASVGRYGLTRRQALGVSSTSSTQADEQVSTALEDGADPRPRASISFTAVYDNVGSRRLLFEPAANDIIIIRNLQPTLATTVEQIRSFRIRHTEYRADDDSLQVEPDVPRPALEFFLARLAVAEQGRVTPSGPRDFVLY